MSGMTGRQAACAIAIAAALWAAPAAAEDLPTLGGSGDAPPAPGWIGLCQAPARDAALDCRVEQRVVIRETGQLVAQVTVRVPADTRKPALIVRVPLRLSLDARVTLDVDGGRAGNLPLQTCDTGGCYAGAPLRADLLAAMQKGDKLNIVFQNLDKAPIRLAMPLAGFGEAYAKIR